MDIPKTYLSRSTSTIDGKLRWRVIHREQPVCADKKTLDEALDVAFEQFRTTDLLLWDGDKGQFVYPAYQGKGQ